MLTRWAKAMLDAEKEDRNKPQKRKGALANLVARCEKLAAGDERFDPTEALGKLQLRKPPPKPKDQKSDDKPCRVHLQKPRSIEDQVEMGKQRCSRDNWPVEGV